MNLCLCVVYVCPECQGNLALLKKTDCYSDDAVYVCSVQGQIIIWEITSVHNDRRSISININFETVGAVIRSMIASSPIEVEVLSGNDSQISSSLTITVTPYLNLSTIICNDDFQKTLILSNCKLMKIT